MRVCLLAAVNLSGLDSHFESYILISDSRSCLMIANAKEREWGQRIKKLKYPLQGDDEVPSGRCSTAAETLTGQRRERMRNSESVCQSRDDEDNGRCHTILREDREKVNTTNTTLWLLSSCG